MKSRILEKFSNFSKKTGRIISRRKSGEFIEITYSWDMIRSRESILLNLGALFGVHFTCISWFQRSFDDYCFIFMAKLIFPRALWPEPSFFPRMRFCSSFCLCSISCWNFCFCSSSFRRSSTT